MNILQWQWSAMTPEFIILGTATLLSLIDLIMKDKLDRRVLGWLGLVGIFIAGFFVVRNLGQDPVQIMNDMFRLDSFGTAFKLLFLSGAALVFFMSIQQLDQREIPYHGEFYYLVLTGVLGAMIMASSADFITLFVGLEVLSISSYILVGTRKKHIQSNESAFKYAVSGGIASAVALYGMSFIYGLTGSTNLYMMGERLAQAYQRVEPFQYSPIIYLGFFLLFVGLSFKIATVPYHMWAPDVYQGAPVPVTAFLAVVSKTAGFAIIVRILLTGFKDITEITDDNRLSYVLFDELSLYIGVIAAVTMIIGNTLALRQTNVKRMMAYSSIAHAGYLLIPLAAFYIPLFLQQMLFYLLAYLLMTLGAFAVIMVVTRDRGTEDIKSFAGLYHRAPWMAFAMTIFLLSLAGIPVTAGFFGKFYIFMSSLAHGKYLLAAIMIATSIISYVYYFAIIRQMYMRPGDTEAKMFIPSTITIVILITAVATVLIGLFPGVVLEFIVNNFNYDLLYRLQ